MADITYTKNAVPRRDAFGVTPGKGNANALQVLCSAIVEISPSASGTTYYFGSIPTNARITSLSKISWDALTTTGAATFDLGLASVKANVTSDPNALSENHDVTSLGTAGALNAAQAFGYSKHAWDYVSGVSTDPGGELDVYGTLKDAAVAGVTGSVTVELYGYFD